MTGYQEVNRANWDDRVPVHVVSPDYAVERFAAEPDFISDVVRFDLPLLGDVTGLRGVHLQCHIGTDTISLARLGASMTGLDFSGPAIEAAAKLAARAGANAAFVRSDVYAALAEHDSVPWNALPGLMEPVTERRMAGGCEWRLAAGPRRLPHTFTLQAVKDE